jgi:flavin reductase (DIM6/NTAB) family NADH-FMN oxidoreductase RutF
MHRSSEPSILYFGTPVVLITSENENGTYNLAPISSAFWLGLRCIIGIGSNTQTAWNLARKRECVLNLPINRRKHLGFHAPQNKNVY